MTRKLREIEAEWMAWRPESEQDIEDMTVRCKNMALAMTTIMFNMHPLEQRIAVAFTAAWWLKDQTDQGDQSIEHYMEFFESMLRDHLEDLNDSEKPDHFR